VNDYYEEPYAGKSHVRFCEGHKFRLTHKYKIILNRGNGICLLDRLLNLIKKD